MKTTVAITLLIFIGFVSWAVFRQLDAREEAGPTIQPSSAVYTPAEVAQHATREDCWLILDGSVYNVTAYLPDHPGGPESIIGACGSDATAGFQRIVPHQAGTVGSLLDEFRIGEVFLPD